MPRLAPFVHDIDHLRGRQGTDIDGANHQIVHRPFIREGRRPIGVDALGLEVPQIAEPANGPLDQGG